MAAQIHDSPYNNKQLLVPKHLLEELEVKAAIDRGGTLTKIVYASKDYADADHYELNFALFENNRFENGLRWMRKHALLPEAGHLRITGIGGELYGDLIREILNLEIAFVDEFVTHTKGAFFLLSNFAKEKFTWQDDLSNDDLCKLTINDDEKKVQCLDFPVLLTTVGSAFPYSLMQADGTMQLAGFLMTGGKSFLGLSKLLIGTNDYDEIMNLADKGCCSNVDTQVKEMLNDAEGSYRHLSPDLPIFSFGKAIDQNLSLDKFRREDLAHSLVCFFANCLLSSMEVTIKAMGIPRIRCLVVGNWARSEVVRREMRRLTTFQKGSVELSFASNGHTGALGAMLIDPSKVASTLSPKPKETAEK